MEKQQGIDQPISNSPIKWPTILFGAVVTIVAFEKIVFRWKSYDWLNRSLSVVLLANLALLLVLVFREKKGKRKLQPDMLLLAFYMCLMLTTIVFNYR
jgi:hypothetical protein